MCWFMASIHLIIEIVFVGEVGRYPCVRTNHLRVTLVKSITRASERVTKSKRVASYTGLALSRVFVIVLLFVLSAGVHFLITHASMPY